MLEKDTVFSAFQQLDFFKELRDEFILITGKGYPDLATRRFLRVLSESFSIPSFFLGDADPYGAEIYLTYRSGSLATICENPKHVVPCLEWLGPKFVDF